MKLCCLSDLQKDWVMHQIYETMQLTSLQKNWKYMSYFFQNFVCMFFSKALQHKAVSSTASGTLQLKIYMKKGYMASR